MTMTKTHHLDRFRHQQPMAKAPPMPRDDVRSDEGSIRRMTGKSGPAAPPGHHHVHYHAHGDHRQPGLHSGTATASKAPHITAGRPAVFGRNGNGNGGSNNGP
jgi:hypothetical protein